MQSGEFWLAATPVHTLYTCAGCNPRRWRQPVCAFGTCKAANLAGRHPCLCFIYVCGLPPQTTAATRVRLRYMQSGEFGCTPPINALYTCAGCHPRRWRQPVCAFGTCKATNFGCTPQVVLYIRVRIAPPHPHTDDSSQPVCAEGTLPSIAPDFRAQRVVGGVLRPHTKRAEGTQLYPNVFRIITEIYITFAVRQRN